MSDYRSWRPIYQAMCPEPGPRDFFLVVLVNGKQVGIHHATDHEQWKATAEKIAREEKCQVKVLPMTGRELMNFLGIAPEPPQPIANLDPTFRKQAVQNCVDVLRERNAETYQREDALDLLRHLEVLQ